MDPMTTVFDAACPTRKVLENISKKWAALILCLLAKRSYRFGEILNNIEGISQKVLTSTLRTLERDGLIARTVDSSAVPISVTYSLTKLGQSLAEPLGHIRSWSELHVDEVVQAQALYDQNNGQRR
jgi:DNA-binding HxlR family transcriptional regulator